MFVVWIALALGLVVCGSARGAQDAPATGDSPTVRLDLTLLDGTKLSGLLVDHTGHGLVVFDRGAPYVFAWSQLDPGSAYRAKRAILVLERGSERALTGEDHFGLGRFLLGRDRVVAAVRQFDQAKRLNPQLAEQVRQAMDERRRRVSNATPDVAPFDRGRPAGELPAAGSETARLIEALPGIGGAAAGAKAGAGMAADARITPTPPEQVPVIAAQLADWFLPRLRERINPKIVLRQTPHFLVFTDLPESSQARIVDWAERAYAALCEQFGFAPDDVVFLGKCPLLCFRSRTELIRFARAFDGYDPGSAVGYTRSVQQRGYAHVALYLRSVGPADLDRFAWTLVHEESHAFLHRVSSSRLIPHWVNEGMAEWMAERVLGDRCPAGENADLIARSFARYDWPVGNLLRSVNEIQVHQYPIAHSIVAFLHDRDPAAFRRFILGLKAGQSTAAALDRAYAGLTLDDLESQWKQDHR